MEISNVAESLVGTLSCAKVKHIYAIVGDSLNAVSDAIRRDGTIELIHVRHEESGAFAASAEAQLTGNIAACAGSSGPGAVHLANGLFDAKRSYAPVLAVLSDIPSSEIGMDYFQDTHPLRFFADCCDYCEIVANGAQSPRIFQIAVQKAIGRGGVAGVVLPGDVCTQKVGDIDLKHSDFPDSASVSPDSAQVDALVAAINSASRVTLFCGDGCSKAVEIVDELSKKINAPIAYTLRGKQWVGWLDNGVGMTGLLGWGGAGEALDSCDLLIILGADFPYPQWLPSDKTSVKIAQIDCRAENLGKRSRVDIGIVGDVGKTLSLIMDAVRQKTERAHLDASLEALKKSRQCLDAYVKNIVCDKLPHPEAAESIIDKYAPDDAIFTVPTGLGTVWAAHYLRASKARRIIGSFTHGSMACELPMAIGAQLACPDKTVVALCGDGGFTMLMGELLTVAQYNLPVKIFVFNNSTLGFIDLEMLAAGYPPFGTSMKNPNFSEMAKICAITGIRIDDGCKLEEGISQAFKTSGPVLVDIVTDPHSLVIPPKVTFSQAYNFSLGVGKMMLSGNIERALNLFKSNERAFTSRL